MAQAKSEDAIPIPSQTQQRGFCNQPGPTYTISHVTTKATTHAFKEVSNLAAPTRPAEDIHQEHGEHGSDQPLLAFRPLSNSTIPTGRPVVAAPIESNRSPQTAITSSSLDYPTLAYLKVPFFQDFVSFPSNRVASSTPAYSRVSFNHLEFIVPTLWPTSLRQSRLTPRCRSLLHTWVSKSGAFPPSLAIRKTAGAPNYGPRRLSQTKDISNSSPRFPQCYPRRPFAEWPSALLHSLHDPNIQRFPRLPYTAQRTNNIYEKSDPGTATDLTAPASTPGEPSFKPNQAVHESGKRDVKPHKEDHPSVNHNALALPDLLSFRMAGWFRHSTSNRTHPHITGQPLRFARP
ncbi:hypothetical protein BGZ63DRAFT_406210 [Mariannaea sp. PMI_226]|nr:hypothetical protein BGZ63DRAFT_406210 [Mariannaea sp. PMI_226]